MAQNTHAESDTLFPTTQARTHKRLRRSLPFFRPSLPPSSLRLFLSPPRPYSPLPPLLLHTYLPSFTQKCRLSLSRALRRARSHTPFPDCASDARAHARTHTDAKARPEKAAPEWDAWMGKSETAGKGG